MSEPPEIKAAQEKLDKTVREFVEVCKRNGEPLLNEEAIVTGYVLIVEGMHYREDGYSATSMGEVYDGGEMRLSSAVGIVSLALDRLRGIGNPDD